MPKPDTIRHSRPIVLFAPWANARWGLQTLKWCALAALVLSAGLQVAAFLALILRSMEPNQDQNQATLSGTMLATIIVVAILAVLVIGVTLLVGMANLRSAPDRRVAQRASLAIVAAVITAFAIIFLALSTFSPQQAPHNAHPHGPVNIPAHESLATAELAISFAAVLIVGTFTCWILAHAAIGPAVGDPGASRAAYFFLAGAFLLIGLNIAIENLMPPASPRDFYATANRAMISGFVEITTNAVVSIWYFFLCSRGIRAIDNAVAASQRDVIPVSGAPA